MKVILLTLPVPEPFHRYQKGNHQLFCEYITAIAEIEGVKDLEIIKLPREITDLANNQELIRFILTLNPDVVGFSSYLWNIERNRVIARVLQNNGIITVTGGPEVQADHPYLLKEPVFNYIVQGEGEISFIKLLKIIREKPKLENKWFSASDEPVDYNRFLRDYARMTNQYQSDQIAYIEVERGCPYHCSYCAYGKSKKRIASIDMEIFSDLLTLFLPKEIQEIYLLAPTLNRNKERFHHYLNKIIQIKERLNRNPAVFAELRPELITEEEFPLMARAGFKEIEFGIQSLNPLIARRTKNHKQNFDLAEFTGRLLDNGITPMIDFIIGLPQDTLENVINTIDFLENLNLLKYANFYHLQVLPGTQIRQEFGKNNYLYQKQTPYLAIQTDRMNFNDIKKAYLYLEAEKNYSYLDTHFIDDPARFYFIRNIADFIKLMSTPYYQTAAFVLVDNFSESDIIRFYKEFIRSNPEIFHLLYLYSDFSLHQNMIHELQTLFVAHKNYYDFYREAINYSGNDSFSKRIIVLLNPETDQHDVKNLPDYVQIGYLLLSDTKLNRKISRKLEKKFENEGIFTYRFADHSEEGPFVKKFPVSFNLK